MGAFPATGTFRPPPNFEQFNSLKRLSMMRRKNPLRREKNARLQKAIEAIEKRDISIRKAACDYDVPHQTLNDRINGKHLPSNKAQESQMHLTNAEEKEL